MSVLQIIGPAFRVLSDTFALRGYNNELKQALKEGDEEKQRDVILRGTQNWSQNVLKSLNVDINVIGWDNLPKEGPVVFIANHQSYLDVPALLYASRNFQTGFIAKKVLGKIPIVGPWITRIGSLFIDRGDARKSLQTINQGAEMIKNGNSLVIFPEGTRAQDGVMKSFKPGSFKLAFKSGAPIVPVTIHDSYKRYELEGKIVPGTIDLVIHKPVEVKGLDKHGQTLVVQQVENTIRESLEELENGSRD